MHKAIFSICCLLSVLFFSCQNTENQADNTFRMNLDEGLTTLDPALARDQRTIWMTSQIFEGLVSLDSSLTVKPAIAKNWELSEDGKTYTFYLRKDVAFHKHAGFGEDSNRKVVAQDVKYSFTRICDSTTASTGAWIFSNRIEGLKAYKSGKNKEISGFEVLNDSTFRIHLEKPYPPFLSLLAMPYSFIVPKEIVDVYGKDFGHHPIGTGAFQFFQWREGSYLLLHKNPNYYQQGLPYLSAIYVQFIPSKLSAFVAFIQQKLDFLNDIDNSYKDEVLTQNGEIQANYKSKYNFFLTPQLITYYVGVMTDSSKYLDKNHPLLDKNIRKALAYSIDKEKFVRFLLNNLGYPANQGFIPNSAKGFSAEKVKGYNYQPEEASKIIRNYEQQTGKKLAITLYAATSRAYVAEFLQKEWERAGIKTKIEVLQPGTLRKEIYAGKPQLWLANWIGDYPDAEGYLGLLYTENAAPNGPNTTHFTNNDFDKLYKDALNESNDSLRYEMYHKMENLSIAECPLIPLYYGRIFRITQKNISGLSCNAMNFLDLKYVKKEK